MSVHEVKNRITVDTVWCHYLDLTELSAVLLIIAFAPLLQMLTHLKGGKSFNIIMQLVLTL